MSRAGLKLAHALDEFKLDVSGLVCADFGCNVGGFTDCLLQRGAAKVHAIDTGYGTLAWKLRNDPRVVAMERTNALHAEPPPGCRIDLVTIDLAWTPQRHSIPAALRWLDASREGNSVSPGRPERGLIITLVKPHYELNSEEKHLLIDGTLPHAEAERVLEHVLAQLPAWGAQPLAHCRSPVTGAKSSQKTGKKAEGGNIEFLVLATKNEP